MFTSTRIAVSLGLLVGAGAAFAQVAEKPKNENGSVLIYGDSGWSFGFPAVRAAVAVQGVGSAISPEKKTLIAPGIGVGVRAWKFLMPFAEIAAYDTGKATASVGKYSSEVQADTLTFMGGMRLIGGHGRARAYGEFGGGMLYQNLKGTFTLNGVSQAANGSASLGAFMFGGGVQVFGGKKWGSDIGFDAFHVTQPMNGAGQNFSRVKIGVFYQTKSTIE